MKKLFKIFVIICPLLNFGLLIFLADQNAAASTEEKEKTDKSGAVAIFEYASENAPSIENNLNAIRIQHSTRSYIIEYGDCFEE